MASVSPSLPPTSEVSEGKAAIRIDGTSVARSVRDRIKAEIQLISSDITTKHGKT
jgi:hypothetical protein